MASGRWLSHNRDKAGAELFFLATSPFWMTAVATVILTGWVSRMGDAEYLWFAVATMSPAVLGPAFAQSGGMLGADPYRGNQPFWQRYWFKFNVWIAIVVIFGTYVGTQYFFDRLGMHYGFPVQWTLDAEVVGRSSGRVPLFMYPLTHAYFITYFAVVTMVLRWVKTRWSLGWSGQGVAVLGLAYATALAQTSIMATDVVSPYFAYADRSQMLWVGSLGYAIYFVVGLPMVSRIDEHGEGWPLGRVVVEALATCTLILFGLELWAHVVGPIGR